MEAKNEYKKPVESGQDIYTICVQEYGSLNAIFLLLADNPSLDLKRKLIPGEIIKFRVELPNEIPLNKNLMDYFRTKQIRVNNKEKVLLFDDCVIVTNSGSTILSANGAELAPASCETEQEVPTPLTGILTNDGKVLTTKNNQLILPITPPTLGNNNGFSLLTSKGQEINIFIPDNIFLQTALGDNILTSDEELLIMSISILQTASGDDVLTYQGEQLILT